MAEQLQQQQQERRRGRPPGSKTRIWNVVESIPAGCPHCGSTEREVIRIKKTNVCRGHGIDGDGYRELEHAGETADGRTYTHTVWRRVKCTACYGYWVEMRRERRAKPAVKAEPAAETLPISVPD